MAAQTPPPTLSYDRSSGSSSPPYPRSNTSSSSTPTPGYDPPITFSTVIEDDHNTINTYAGRLLRAATPQERARLLREVTWRLVRHDVSEDLVMRPAFVAQLGEVGRQMAVHDQEDHDRARRELLRFFHSTGVDDAATFTLALRALFADLLEHMKIESGEQIPHLERMLHPDESARLGREYMKTQVLTPDLEIVDPSTGTRRRVWRDVEDYANTPLVRFHQIYAQLSEEDLARGVEGYHKLRAGARGRL